MSMMEPDALEHDVEMDDSPVQESSPRLQVVTPVDGADEPASSGDQTKFARSAMLLAIAALASCWLGPLGLILAMSALVFGVFGHARLRKAELPTGKATRAITIAGVALLISVFSTPVVLGYLISHTLEQGKGQISKQVEKNKGK